MKFSRSFTFIFSILVLIASCGPKEFATHKESEKTHTDKAETTTVSGCKTPNDALEIKAPVDFLILLDNSSSKATIPSNISSKLVNTLNILENTNFDYHLLMAPLIATNESSMDGSFFISYKNDGLSQEVINNYQVKNPTVSHIKNKIQAVTQAPTDGSKENGISRAVSLLKNNISNGIFRKKAYTIIVIMSNQDDNSYFINNYPTHNERDKFISTKTKELLCLRGNYSSSCTGESLDSRMMRLMSIVPHAECLDGYDTGHTYKAFSFNIYSSPYTNGIVPPDDQKIRENSPPDSYNLCNSKDFSSVFDGINSSISSIIIKHKYNFWPVALPSGNRIDPNKLSVTKNGILLNHLSKPVQKGESGFTFDNIVQTINTRIEPTPGEPFTGYLIELHGSAMVQYPECISIETSEPADYFGYAVISMKPYEDSIQVKINGKTIDKGGENGWELIKENGAPKYFDNFNIRITGPKDHIPKTPAVNRKGYIIKLKGTSIYTNGESPPEVIYDPSS